MSIKKLYFSLIAILATALTFAQVYPVQVNSTVLPPYLSTVASYSTTVNQKYLVNIFTADLSTVNRQARLKLYIEGNGILAQSQAVVNGATPIYLNGGETLSLSNLDLAPYFQIENLQGITPAQYANVLPQGTYKFCIEVYDYLTNQRISQKSCTFYYFLYNEPPLLNLPQNHSVVFFQDPQNIIFTWTPRHINATNIEYLFELVELLDDQAPSNYAFMVGAPLYSTTVSNTILHYGPAETQLIAGRKYAWRVRAQSQPGFGETAVFNNNGYSEIFDFVYPGNCEAPKFVLATSLNATQAKITWQPDPKHLDYKVEYRKQGTTSWFTTAHYNNEAKLYDLEPGATYEFRVGGECLGNIMTYSTVNTFTQPTTDSVGINCGIQPTIDLANQSLFSGQLPNDQVIMAGDFSIKLTEVAGTGTYTGKGYTTVPYLSFVKIGVEFKNIKINTDFKLVQGEIKASYDPEWDNIIDVASLYDQIENLFDAFSPDTDEHSYQVDFVIPDGLSITVNGNSVVVIGPNGEIRTFDLDLGEIIIIRDIKGNVYGIGPGSSNAVPLDPTKQDAAGFIPNKDNTEGLSSNGTVTAFSNVGARVSFKKATGNSDNKNSQFADDAKPAGVPDNIAKLYKSIPDGNGNYDLYHKGIQNDGKATRSTDFVEAVVDITDATIKADSIQFNIKGSKAKKVVTKTVGGKIHFVLEVPIFETAQTFELLALLKPTTNGGKNRVIGASKIIPIKIRQEVNVTVVPVNGADIPTNIESQLNAIYDPAAVKLKVTLAPNYEVAKTTMECDKDYLLEKLSADQSSFIDAYKQGREIKKDQYYVFITKGITPSKPISGFMPRHSQFGFVFTNQSGSEAKATSDLATIVAHELGHGVFELEHPWSQFSTGDKNSNTPWLMDYTAGTTLAYPHWQRISHPKFGLYVFDGSSQGELASGYGLTPDFKFLKTNTSKVTYLKNAGEGFLGGFVFNKNGVEEDYFWDASKKYIIKGTTTVYPGEIKSTLNDSDIVYLIFDKTKFCPENKYLRTLYKNIKNIKDSNDLEAYINDNKNKNFSSSPEVYAKNIECTPAIKAQEGNGNENIVDVNNQNINIVRDCGTDAFIQKSVFTGDNNVTTWGEVIVKYLNYNLDGNKKNKFGDNLSGLNLKDLKYINPSLNYRGDPIFAPVYIEELNNKLAYLEVSTGIQLHINFIETSCSFSQIEGNKFAQDIFMSSAISKEKGIYVLIVRNRNAQNVLEWKTYFAFGSNIGTEIKSQAETLLTINATEKFKTFGQLLIQFYKYVPKKQLQYVYVIEKATPEEIRNNLNLSILTKNIYSKVATVNDFTGNAIQAYFILKDTQTNTYSPEPLVLDITHDLKEQYVAEYGLDLAKRIATETINNETAGWSYKYRTAGMGGEPIENDVTPTILKCRFSFNQTCNSYYIDTAFLVAGIVTIPFGNVAVLVDGVAIVYYGANGQTDTAAMYLAGYALGPIIGQTVKGIAVVAPKMINFTKRLYVEGRLMLQMERGLTEQGVKVLLEKELNTGVKEFLIPYGSYGNAFIKATDDELLAGYIKTEQNVDKLVVLVDKKGTHSLSGKLNNATDIEVREAFEMVTSEETKWLLWSQYAKKVINGEEFAIVGNKYFSKSAVESMVPSGLGGAGIPPSAIEDVIANGDSFIIGTQKRFDKNAVFVLTENNASIVRSIRVNKVSSISDLATNPHNIFGYLDNELDVLLTQTGWVKGSYGGTSDAVMYFKQTNAGRSEIVFNYGGGLHSAGQTFKKPYYYKLEGPEFGRRIRVIDKQTYPASEFQNAIQYETFKLVDGPTGIIWKQ